MKSAIWSIIILFFSGAMQSHANLSCTDLLTEVYSPKQIFTEAELHSLESITAAYISSRIEKKRWSNFHGLTRVVTDTPNAVDVNEVIGDLSSEQRASLSGEIESFVYDFTYNRDYSFPSNLESYLAKMEKELKGHTFSPKTLRMMLQRPGAQEEAIAFLKESMDSVLVNAALMPIQNTLGTLVTKPRIILLMVAAAVGTGVSAMASEVFGLGAEGAELAMKWGAGLVPVGVIFSEWRSQDARPMYVFYTYRNDLNVDVVERYSMYDENR